MFETLRVLATRRGLLVTLVRRELAARYRGSALGFLWSLVNPLLLLSVYALVFGWILDGSRFGAGSSSETQVPYALFLITGLFPWIWASSSLLEATSALASNAGLIRKAVFPIRVLPVVSVGSNLMHFLLALPILIGALVIGRLLGHQVLGASSVLVVLVVALELLMLAGLALGLSALNVHFKDTRDLLANLLQLLFFLAPILYPLDFVPQAARLAIRLNPFTPFTLAFQELLLRGEVPHWSLWGHMALLALLCWGAGAWLFGRLEDTIVEAV